MNQVEKKAQTLGLMLWIVIGKEESEGGEAIELEERMQNVNANTDKQMVLYSVATDYLYLFH